VSARRANRRIRLLLAFFVAAFAATLARAVWLQGIEASSLAARATAQHRERVNLPAGRGTIYDRMGFQLAIGEQATTVYADPRQVTDARRVARAARRILGVSAKKLYPQLVDRRRAFVYVSRKADPAKAAELEKVGLAGLGFYPEERRSYPQGSVASQLLGFAGIDNDGLAGIEKEYDRDLAGRPGTETIVKDPFGRALDVLSTTPEREGSDVYLTIDHTIQANAESVLRATVAHWGARAGTAIVLDPRTGAVLAMASTPGFNPNRFWTSSLESQKNRAVTDVYEPGSTFKLVTVAGVLSDRLVSPATRFRLPYSIHVADRVVHDAEPRGTETMSVARILSHSSNVGAVTLAEKLGPERLSRWIARFGFGRTTGIDFPGESAGLVLPLDRWSGSTIGNVPIGQGIAVTPTQMAAAYAAIANGGVWRRPHVVGRISGHHAAPVERRRIVSPTVASQLKAMLMNVVSEGTGTYAKIPGYTVAGKTGTAQKPDGHGGYGGGYVSSFVGFVPASKPRLVVLVTIDNPQGVIWGGWVAAPAFRDIAKFDLQYLEIPPDAPETSSNSSSGYG
jgi:cell division protein FtsI (penicillin-binding protein 3)